MKVNLHMLHDELTEFGGELIGTDDTRSRLEGVRYLEVHEVALSDRILYVTDAETLAATRVEPGPFSFISIGPSAPAFLEDRGWSAILLPASTDRHRLFRALQDIFDKYAQWGEDMLLAIANGEPPQAIFDCGARFLRNPIALFDQALVFVMMAGTLPTHIENTIWEEVLTRGYTRLENLPASEQRHMARLLATNDEPFFYQSTGGYSNHRQIIASLKRNGSQFGTFGMIDILEPFTLGQLSIVSHLKSFMELALKRDLHLTSLSKGVAFYVERLLQGHAIETNTVAYHLAKQKWQIEDPFCLLYVTRSDGTQIDETLSDMYVFRVRSLLTDSMVFAYENGILAINHKDDRTRSDPEYAKELASQLKGMGLCCGVSLVFNDFLGLKPAFIQCKTALASRAGGLDEAIHRFELRYAEHVIRALDDSTSLKSLCHPQVVRLHRLEGPKGPEYVRTLQTYLAHGRSATAAAARVFVHRNTLLYRIKRIEEVLGIDLESADEQMLFMLYLSCLILGRSTP